MSLVVLLTGVYDADGGALGELKYWIGARLGRTHCSLCEVTHSAIRERREWSETRSALSVEFRTVHRDEQSSPVSTATNGVFPAVVAQDEEGVAYLLLGAEDIEQIASRAEPHLALVEAVEQAGTVIGLSWPAGSLRNP